MAIGLQNQLNINGSNTDYPNGSLRDKTSNLPGTPVNKRVYDDIHQFFAKFLRIVNTPANGLPDNEYSGLQYVTALLQATRSTGRIVAIRLLQSTLVDTSYDPFVIVLKNAASSQTVSMDVVASAYTNRCKIANYSAFTVQLYSNQSYNIHGSPGPFPIPPGTIFDFEFDGTAWQEKSRFILP